MKRLILLLLVAFGLVYFYYWYVRGIDILLNTESVVELHEYSAFATRLPGSGSVDAVSSVWLTAASMPTERKDVGAAFVDGRIYVVGGVDALAQSLDAVEALDVESQVWSIVAPLPKALHHVAVVTDGEVLYAIGGLSGFSLEPSDSLYIYSPEANVWTRGRLLPRPLGATAAVYREGVIHVVGGREAGGPSDVHFVYDIAEDTWSEAESTVAVRQDHVAATIGRDIIVTGGNEGSLLYNTRLTDVYDIADGDWERVAAMPTRRSSAGAVTHDGKLYVFGGEAITSVFATTEVYDPVRDTWSTGPAMPTPRHGMGVVNVDGHIFTIGGGQRPGLSVSGIVEIYIAE